MKFRLESPPPTVKKCPRCGLVRALAQFKTNRGTQGRECRVCRTRYNKPVEQRGPLPWRLETPLDEPLRVRFIRESMNVKLGAIPCSTSSPSTCPRSCAWFGRGCYAEAHYIGARWRQVAKTGMTWYRFCAEIASLPPGQLWRHNEAGDLPGYGEHVDEVLLDELVKANDGRRGFTFTHKHSLRSNRPAIEAANAAGFAINLSLDSLAQVDEKREQGWRVPLTVVVPSDAPQHMRTPGGAHVIVCPAQVREEVTCSSCGMCALPRRKAVIAFRAHGHSANLVSRAATNLRLPMVR